MSFNPTLEQNLLTDLEDQGPIDVAVYESQYHSYLVPQMRLVWQQTDRWSPREQKIVLLFFRAYSFFRELSDSENEFWKSLHKELQLPDTLLLLAHYDLLEKALKSDQRIKNLFIIQRNRREFVKTIDAIWGIRSLNARTLEKLFRYYYFEGIETVNAAFIQKTLRTEPADVVERAIRQKASYNRIFGGLKNAIAFVLERKIVPEPLETLSERVKQAGHTLSDPNPIEFFRNKAEKALRNLLATLSGTAKTTTPSSRTKRIEIEDDFVANTTQHKKRREFPVTIQYPENTVEFGEAYRLEFLNVRAGRKVLELTGATKKTIQVYGSNATFLLEIGETFAQLFVDGEPATAKKRLTCLPELTWTFLSHRHEPLRFRPLEHQTLLARIELADGCFIVVPWQARWDELGAAPIGTNIDVQLEEYQIQATLYAESHAIRFFGADDTPLEVLTERECRFRLLPNETIATHRVQLASAFVFAPLEQWHTLHANFGDELIVERQSRTDWWEVVGRIPVQIPPVIHEIKLEGRNLVLHASAPKNALWKIGADPYIPVQTAPSQITLPLKRLWSRQDIEVQLLCNNVVYHQQVLYCAPNLSLLLEHELQTGLGWGAWS